MKILYAEDEPAMSEAVTDVLTYHKYNVDAVADGEEALAYAEAEDYDAIILDVMMPKLSGIEVLKKLRDRLPHQALRHGRAAGPGAGHAAPAGGFHAGYPHLRQPFAEYAEL